MPGRHTLLRLGDELTRLARPSHELLATEVARRTGVSPDEGVAYAVDRLGDLPLYLRAGVDAIALALAAVGPERAIDTLDRAAVPLVDMYPRLVRSLVLFAASDRKAVDVS